MVSLTEQVRLRAAVEVLTTTPNTRSATGATEDSIATSREPGGTGRGERREKKGRRKSSTISKSSSVPQYCLRMAYWSLSLFRSPPEAPQCLSSHCRCSQLLAGHQSQEEWSD